MRKKKVQELTDEHLDLIVELKSRSGNSLMKCKQVLQESGWNINTAINSVVIFPKLKS